MDKDKINIVFADNIPPSLDPTGTLFNAIAQHKQSNTRSLVMLIVAGLVSIFLIGNFALYAYAQKSLPLQKKKGVSAKKMKKEKIKHGVSAQGP